MKSKVILSVLMLTLTTAGYGMVIGDFENGSLDGWEMLSGAAGASSSFGATRGDSSLEIVFPAEWNSIMKLDAASLAGALASATEITLDASVRNDENQIPGWWLDPLLIINSDLTGWKELTKTGWGGVEWSPTTYPVSFEITQEIRDALAGDFEYLELFIATNSGGGTFWVDNIQIVPEPATLAMLGFGGLALIRRKR